MCVSVVLKTQCKKKNQNSQQDDEMMSTKVKKKKPYKEKWLFGALYSLSLVCVCMLACICFSACIHVCGRGIRGCIGVMHRCNCECMSV